MHNPCKTLFYILDLRFFSLITQVTYKSMTYIIYKQMFLAKRRSRIILSQMIFILLYTAVLLLTSVDT